MSDQLFAGYAETDYTPAPGLTLLGQMHRRVATAARDPLMANASAFRSGDTTVVLVSVDICMLPSDFNSSVQQAFSERTGVPGECLLLHATHTHVAPTVFPLLTAEVDEAFKASLHEAIVSAATTAVERLEPVELFAGTGHMEHMGWNRRAMLEGGKSQMYASSESPGFIGMEGPRDPALPVMFTRNAQGEIKGVVVNFSTHPNSIEGESVYSADVPGASRKTLKQLLGQDVVVVYLTGAAANTAPSILDPVNVDQPWRGHAGVDRSGLYLGSEAAKVIAAAIDPVRNPVVRIEKAVINAPIREWPEPESPQYSAWRDESGQGYYSYCAGIWPEYREANSPVPVNVNVVRIGDVAICTNPAELFVEFGLQMREGSPARVTMVAELMDGYVGYIPTPIAFERGGYETWTALTSQLIPGTGEKVVETTQELMKAAWK